MKTSTILRICGAAIILMILVIIGTYDFTGPGVAIAIFGFPVLFEVLIVRPVLAREKENADS